MTSTAKRKGRPPLKAGVKLKVRSIGALPEDWLRWEDAARRDSKGSVNAWVRDTLNKEILP